MQAKNLNIIEVTALMPEDMKKAVEEFGRIIACLTNDFYSIYYW